MSAAEAGLGVGGIVISLITFWLGYKQTIGAKQERLRATDAEIETTVLKRILLERYTPTVEELERYIRGKAVAARMNVSELRPVHEVVALLWARMLDNDLVPAERREEALQALQLSDKMDLEVPSVRTGPVSTAFERRRRRVRWEAIAALAVGAALIGTAVSAAPALRDEVAGVDLVELGGIFAAALTLIAAFATVLGLWSGAEGFSVREPETVIRAYPDREAGLEALGSLRALSPLAVATLGRFGHDEFDSGRLGIPRGYFVRPGGTPWHQELIDAGLLRPEEPPPSMEPRGRQFLVLTDRGKDVARLVIANEPVPDWFKEVVSEGGYAARDSSPPGGSDGADAAHRASDDQFA